MKILHALVSYLALTTLPFQDHSFAFASPLTLALAASSIDYDDGYVTVDAASNLNNIVEPRQTRRVPTQNHSHSDLMKRVYAGDDLESRQITVPPAIPVVGLIFFLVADVVFTIVWISKDDPVRSNYIDVNL